MQYVPCEGEDYELAKQLAYVRLERLDADIQSRMVWLMNKNELEQRVYELTQEGCSPVEARRFAMAEQREERRIAADARREAAQQAQFNKRTSQATARFTLGVFRFIFSILKGIFK